MFERDLEFVPVPVDLESAGGQDPNDPVWVSHVPDPTGADDPRSPNNMHELGEHPGIRTLHNLLDLLHDVVDDGGEGAWQDRENGLGHRLSRKPRRTVFDVYSLPSMSWRATTITVPVGVANQSGAEYVKARADRHRVVITNWGPGVVYASHDTAVTGAPNTVQIPVNGSREFRHSASVWLVAAVGTAPVVDIQEEYILDGERP